MSRFRVCARRWWSDCLFWCLTVPLAAHCVGQATGPFPLYGDDFAHDPSTLIKEGSSYFIYADGQGITALTSTDLRNWSGANPIFTTNIPAWTTNNISGFTGYFWAPDVAYFNGQYNLYYACSEWGTINSAIGLATSPSLTSPVWTDQGKVVQSNYPATTNTDTTAYNCIDPSILVETNGTVWMSYGSYSSGILVTQINPATGMRMNTNSLGTMVSNNGGGGWGSSEEGSYLYQHGGYYYLFVNFGGCCAGVDSTYNIRVGRSPTVTGPYFDPNGVNMTNGGGRMVLESNARYIGPGQAAIMNDNGTNWFTFHYYDGNNGGAATLGLMRINWTADGWPALTNDWSAFYPFTTDAREHLGLYNGALVNHASITNDASLGKVLNLDGATNYVVLADPVANCSTIMGWVKWNGGSAWQRIFDFGSGTTNYFFLTPLSNAGTMRFAITTNSSGGGEQQINATMAPPIGSWCQVAVTLNGSQGLLYLNGVPVGTNANLTIRPWQILASTNYLGKSQWPGDPLFNGRLDSFRFFGRALSGTEIQGFAQVPPALAHRYSFTNDASDSIGMAQGTLMGNAAVTNQTLRLTGATGGYVNLPGGLVSGCAAATIEFWATFGANAAYARVFDFGNISGANGQKYLFFSPHDASGAHHLEISNSTVALAIPGALDNRTVCVTCIVDPTNSYWAIYTNGILESAKTSTLPPLTSLSGAWSFLGRSLFSADPYLNAVIDEFRIYDGRLTQQQIATDFQYGPGALALPVTLAQTNAAAGWTLSWPSWAVGFAAQSSTNLLNWTTNGLTPGLTNDLWSLTLPKTNTVKFYRLQR